MRILLFVLATIAIAPKKRFFPKKVALSNKSPKAAQVATSSLLKDSNDEANEESIEPTR